MTEDVAHYVSLARRGGRADRRARWSAAAAWRSRSRARPGKPVLGIDSSPAMLEIARERVGRPAARAATRRHARARARGARGARSTSRSARSSTCTAGRRSGDVFERVAASLRPGGRFAFNAFAFSHTIAARLDGTTPEPERRRAHAPLRPGRQPDRASGATTAQTIRLWWATKSEWDGLIDVAGLEVEALYGGFDARAVHDESLEFVYVARKP